MKPNLFYFAFYGAMTKGVAGQQNLSLPVRDMLARHFHVSDLSCDAASVERFPKLAAVVAGLHRILLARCLGSGRAQVTVVDMVHSLAVLPRSRACDRLVVIGHDSYALRTLRDLRRASGVARLRLAISWLGWSYVEFLLRRLAWWSIYVSPVDAAYAGRTGRSSVVAIPVTPDLIEYGRIHLSRAASTRRRPRVLVSMPVVNPQQNRIDAALLGRLVRLVGDRADVTLWGQGAELAAAEMGAAASCDVIRWVDDYPGFLSAFDLLVYPRMIGSGFHTKLAEALVLGVPCLCVDWIAEPLRVAGYDGLWSFTDESSFEAALKRLLSCLCDADSAAARPVPPPAAHADDALRELVSVCARACQEASPE